MDIFNLNLPPEDEKNKKFPKLDAWFDFMNNQLEKIEQSNDKIKINKLLSDNDIDLI